MRHDDDDPYLVVAADKGTATFSDIANEISVQYGFWLGDAFASGGSAGYDHKKIGITARGAWESVRCHFRSLGVDVDEEEVTVVGIGDMSGDVFGNGMLLSPHIRLVGAFDHRHIFVDPDPDPERSFRERQRLFGLPRSSWYDYDRSAISPGGGVFSRTERLGPLSPEIRAVLGFDGAEPTPDQLVQALLRAPVDLLWSGGVGTFVKASTESASEAGDRTNDAVRVDAADLRCRVVCEGGNLGLTQRARIEFARAGGLVNTDAIDNSAGVDCSDHEVNLKILLDQVVAEGELTVRARTSLLTDMTDEVAGLVLRDNQLQSRALARNHMWGRTFGSAQLLTMRYLEQIGNLDRALECLPTDTAFEDRRANGDALALPELATLLAHAKIHVYDELLRSEVPDDPYVSQQLDGYFPRELVACYRDRIGAHPLRREIIANAVTNDLLNRLDVTFPVRLCDHGDATVPEVACAFAVACEVLGMREVWAQIDGLEKDLELPVQTDLLAEVNESVEVVTRWLLRRCSPPIDIDREIARHAHGVGVLAGGLPDLLTAADREAFEGRLGHLPAALPPDLARRIAGAGLLAAAPDIVESAEQSGHEIDSVAATYFALNDRLELRWLRDQITSLPSATQWDMLARLTLREDLDDVQRDLTLAVLHADGTAPEVDAHAALERWLAANETHVQRAEQRIGEMRDAGGADAATLGIALRDLRTLPR